MICLEVGKQVSGPCMFYCAMHAAEGDGWLDHELHGGGPCLACNRHSTSLDMFRIWMLTNTHLIVLFIGLDIVSDLAATSREAARSLMAVVVRNEETRDQPGTFGRDYRSMFSLLFLIDFSG